MRQLEFDYGDDDEYGLAFIIPTDEVERRLLERLYEYRYVGLSSYVRRHTNIPKCETCKVYHPYMECVKVDERYL